MRGRSGNLEAGVRNARRMLESLRREAEREGEDGRPLNRLFWRGRESAYSNAVRILDGLVSYESPLPVDLEGLPVQVRNCLRQEGIVSWERLARCTEADLMGLPNFGRGSLAVVRDALGSRGMGLREIR